MAKQRMINTKFWSDNFVIELNPLDRYLFLYFLTNEHTNICGIYELPLKRMSDETGIEKDMLLKMMKRLKGKVFYIDGWIYLKNFAKHQSDSESVKIGIKKAESMIPSHILKEIDKINVRWGDGGRMVTPPPEVFEPESKPESKPELEHKGAPIASKINFIFFWELYPKKVEKKKTEVKWNKLDLKTQETIIEDLKKRTLGEKWLKDEGKYIEMPTTYLNGERWNDEIILPKATENKTHRI